MTGKVRFGIGFPNRGILFGSTTVTEMFEMARIVDRSELFDSFWVGDSLLSKPRVEAVATLGALAAITERVRIGPACLASSPLRDPLTFAIQWASLDVLSGGRTVLVTCIGAGGAPIRRSRDANGAARASSRRGEGWSGDWATEFDAYHVEVEDRHARMVESIQVLRRLWTEERVTHQGRFWQFEEVELLPKPIQNPYPIHIANNVRGEFESDLVQNALRRVARLADGWQTAVIYPPDFARRWQRLREFVAEQGKDPDRFENSMYYNVNVNADKSAAREESLEFLRNYYLTRNYPEPAFDAWTAWGSPEEVIERLEGYVGAGVETFIIRFPSWQMRRQLDIFMEKVLPHFQPRLAPPRAPVSDRPAVSAS
jgi:alkanesulfonate monooxygenase SsuD/methylene tetrahydromethanopterin reductase-like flavin-dependent oxidoreductase (luciferase family)